MRKDAREMGHRSVCVFSIVRWWNRTRIVCIVEANVAAAKSKKSELEKNQKNSQHGYEGGEELVCSHVQSV